MPAWRKLSKCTIDQHEGRNTGHHHANRPPRPFDHSNQPERAKPDIGRGQKIKPGFNFGGRTEILINRNT